MNHLELVRLTHDDEPTVGMLSHILSPGEGKRPLCFVIEDPMREVKVAGDTRIPAGCYRLRWREAGRWARRFQKMGYPGSLEICGIPDFTDVLLHIGNNRRDTRGCPLPNVYADVHTRIGMKSTDACRIVYDLVHEAGGDWDLIVR